MAAKKTAPRTRPKPYPSPTVGVARDTHIVPVTQRHAVELVEQKAVVEDKQSALRGLEDELLEQSLTTMRSALKFASVPFGGGIDGEVPDDIKLAFGDKAPEIYRTMKAAQMPTKDAPVGLGLAQKTAAAIIRARSAEKAQPTALNLAVQVVVSHPQFERKTVGE